MGIGLCILGQHGRDPHLICLLPDVEHHAAASPVVTELDLQGIATGDGLAGSPGQHEQGAIVGPAILGAGDSLLPHVAALGEADAIQCLQVQHLGYVLPLMHGFQMGDASLDIQSPPE